ncbi:MAG: hypothetical protein ABI321_00470 [Polyangia bacterium]
MEYVSHDPRAKVRSPDILFIVESFQFAPSLVDVLLKKHGLDRSSFGVAEYVPLQNALDMLKEIEERVGREKLRQLGNTTVEAAMFPPQFVDVESVLLALDMIYSINHLGEVGHYHSKQLVDGAIEVRCETPYPRAFERGVIEGIARNPNLVKGKRYDVEYIEGPMGGDLSCTCIVRRR